MRTARRHPRITDPPDFQAKLEPSDHLSGVDRVLNLSEGGMLIANNKLTVGHETAFELTGPSFHYAGVAEVVHLTNETTGLRFLSWQGHDNRPVRSLIANRSDWQAPKLDAQPDPGVVRRVAVLTGRRRPPRQDPKTPGPELR
jgi:PilZ domain